MQYLIERDSTTAMQRLLNSYLTSPAAEISEEISTTI